MTDEPAINAVDALRRIAFLLERSMEPGYRVRAFRRAASAVEQIDVATLQRLARAGHLQDLPGVGETTAAIIAEALAGQVPAYLQKLEEQEYAPEDDSPARPVLDLLQGDCHTHSGWSDGGVPIREMAQTAIALGRRYMVLTDHSPRLTIANGLTAERLLQQLDVVALLNAELAPFRILTGIEVDILEDGSLDQTDELLSRLDLVVGSVHSKLRMESEAMTARMAKAVANPHLDILGHCTGRLVLGRGRPESTFDAEVVFEACARSGKAVEINSRPERLDPPRRLMELARDAGCTFSIDSDAHWPGQLSWLRHGCEIALGASVEPARIVNTMGADDLIAWAREHGL
jgi:putative hydrolase